MPPCCNIRQGDPFDPEDEGPQECDLRRYGDDAEYTLDELGVGDEAAEEPAALRRGWTTLAALLGLVAFIVAFVIL